MRKHQTETALAPLQARIVELETVIADYAARYGLTELARKAIFGPRMPDRNH
jgi:hypothetical protein